MGTAAGCGSPAVSAEETEKQDKKESRLHKDLHCNCGKRETSTDKRKTEWQSTATTQKLGDSSLRPPLFSCVPPPLRTTPPKPNQCLSVHLSTWSAQMDQEIERRLKGEYREKQKGVSKKKKRRKKKGELAKWEAWTEELCDSPNLLWIAAETEKRRARCIKKDNGGENEPVSDHRVLHRRPTVALFLRLQLAFSARLSAPGAGGGPPEGSEAIFKLWRPPFCSLTHWHTPHRAAGDLSVRPVTVCIINKHTERELHISQLTVGVSATTEVKETFQKNKKVYRCRNDQKCMTLNEMIFDTHVVIFALTFPFSSSRIAALVTETLFSLLLDVNLDLLSDPVLLAEVLVEQLWDWSRFLFWGTSTPEG